jgi:hypothetical protein
VEPKSKEAIREDIRKAKRVSAAPEQQLEDRDARGKGPKKCGTREHDPEPSESSSYSSEESETYSESESRQSRWKVSARRAPSNKGSRRNKGPARKASKSRSRSPPRSDPRAQPRRRQEGGARSPTPRRRNPQSPPPGNWKGSGPGGGKQGKGQGGKSQREAGDGWNGWKYANAQRHTSSASYYEHRSTSSGKGRSGPTPQSCDWVWKQEKQNEYHNFGELHQPTWWPPEYYSDGWPICPPRVRGSIAGFFHAAEANVYIFHNLEFTYIGKQPAAPKPHWAPYPCPPKGTSIKGKGAGKGKKGGTDRAEKDGDREADKDQTKDPGPGAATWFT